MLEYRQKLQIPSLNTSIIWIFFFLAPGIQQICPTAPDMNSQFLTSSRITVLALPRTTSGAGLGVAVLFFWEDQRIFMVCECFMTRLKKS